MGFLDTISKVGGAASGLFNIGSTLIQNNQQKKAQQREFANNKEMWNLANQYNTPEMQMNRLKEAGLNPHLVYGNGSVTGNTSTQTPKYQAPNIQRLPTEMLNPLSILGQFQDLRTKKATADLTEENAKWQHILKGAEISKLQEVTRGQVNQNLIQEWLLGSPMSPQVKGSPYMRKYSADVRSREQQNQIQQATVDMLKNIPKELQWLAPLLMQFIPKP